jgi:hypothetical protein
MPKPDKPKPDKPNNECRYAEMTGRRLAKTAGQKSLRRINSRRRQAGNLMWNNLKTLMTIS